MKTLTVKNPWSWAIIYGAKDVENRTWSTTYRGPLAIHAGQAWSPEGANSLLVKRAIARAGGLDAVYPTYEARGVILGVVDLVDVVQEHESLWAQPGAFHWVLANPRPLIAPYPAKGRLGLWDVPDTELRLHGYTDTTGVAR